MLQAYINTNVSAQPKRTNANNKSRKTIQNYNNNIHVVNTNDPNWIKKEGINNSYNMNVEARKKWLAKQSKKRTRKYRARKNY